MKNLLKFWKQEPEHHHNDQIRLKSLQKAVGFLQMIIITYTLGMIIGIFLSISGNINLATASTLLGTLPVKSSIDNYIKLVNQIDDLLKK